DMGSRLRRSLRYLRVQGLFEDSYSLIPLGNWLPKLEGSAPDRYKEIVALLKQLIPAPISFDGHFEDGEYYFQQSNIKVPFSALSDGYRSFISWITALLYHLHTGCPAGKMLTELKGIVMVDEIDLHLHPEWQKKIVRILAGTFENLQFIFTTHSPIITGNLYPSNITLLKSKDSRAEVVKLSRSVYGLNANQVLVSEYFGLDSTRAPGIKKKIRVLNLRALDGDSDASLELLDLLAKGEEEEAE
ncbi:MAG: AAA family ATPase, partial [bacterium]|nr:AAA family ATPase [bacterium]